MTYSSINNKSSQVLALIKQQVGSNGIIGWPVVMRDRIAYPEQSESIITDANVGVTILWTMRDAVLPHLEKDNLAILANFYTPAGLSAMIRNILSNPFIRYIILFGEEYSSRTDGDKISDRTSANMLRTFFEKGINADRKLEGFENSVYIDKNIPTEYIQKIVSNVELIDLNKSMPNATIHDKIRKANELMRTLPKKDSFMEKPLTFEFEQASDSFPYENGPIIVHGNNIPDSWIKMIYNLYRYGRKNLMNANTDRWIKEINDMVVVIHKPQDMDLSVNPFLVPLTKEKIEAYKKEILSPLLPEGKAYTYGNKLRAYYFPFSKEIKNLVNSDQYKDFEFKKGPWLDKNVSYKGEYCEIDQLLDIIDVLKRDPYSKACVALTWHPADELMRKHKSSPCLVFVQAMVQDEKLNLTVFFRSHDMTQGWPENAYGCAAIQNEIAAAINVEPGILTIISGSAQVYNTYYNQVEDMLKKYYTKTGMCTDKRGNYLIKIEHDEMIVTLMHPESSVVLEEFHGRTAYELRDKIAHSTSLETGHAIYLGTELLRAEIALKEKIPFMQDE
jgi:thymidylate synthase